MSERDLEDYFDSRYGPVRNCKIAKDSTNGRSKTYGYVLFKEGRHANAAMLDSKAGNTEFSMDWYTILAQRPSVKSTNNQPIFDEIQITWRKIEKFSNEISQDDLLKYFSKFGRIVDISFQPAKCMAIITFQTCEEAEFSIVLPKVVIKNHSLLVKPMNQRCDRELT